MTPITAPLQSGSSGPAVVNLQDALALFLDRGVIPPDVELRTRLGLERASQKFDAGTKKLVSIFQDKNNLAASGAVDELTASRMNDLLRSLNSLDGSANPQQSIVAGSVVFQSGGPLASAFVRAFHRLDGAAILLGETDTDGQGRYTIRYDKPPGLVAIMLQVQAATAKGGTPVAATDVRNAKALEIVNLQVANRAGTFFTVDGQVGTTQSAAVGGLSIQIVAKIIGADDAVVANAVTDEQGRYRTTVSDLDLAAKSIAVADLQAKVLQGAAFLAASEVHYGVTGDVTLNVLLADSNLGALVTEHATLKSAISLHFAGSLADLKESDARQDISHLANKTGWDARAVALAALSDRFNRDHATADGSKLPAETYYALFRAGHAANSDTLFQLDRSAVENAWNAARDAGTMSKLTDAELQQHLTTFQNLSKLKVLDAPAAVGVSTLGSLLDTLQLTTEKKTEFARLHVENLADPTKFWTAVAASPVLQADAEKLQFTGKLAFLTINNAPLMQQLMSGQGALSNPLQLAQLGFAAKDKWQASFPAAMQVPSEIPGNDEIERKDNYANYLAAQVRISFPTATVAQLAASGQLNLKDNADDHSPKVASFLTGQQGKFELGTQPIERFLKANPNVVVEQPVLAQLKRLQRVYQITSSDEAIKGLLKTNYDSAYQIVLRDRSAFIDEIAPQFGGQNQAAIDQVGSIYDRALQIHNAVLNIVVGHQTAKNGFALGTPAPNAAADNSRRLLNPQPVPPNGDTVIAYPTLESLFGSMDFCACDQCRSVLSPAAYLVDILHFLDVAPAVAGTERPLDVLLKKRPDVAHLPLTCENTNVAIPYIDIVNETLEYFVTSNNFETYAGHDTAASVSADLLASPQFVIDKAYETLVAAQFPAPLPFSRALELLRGTLAASDLKLSDVLEKLRTKDDFVAVPYGVRDIRIEDLGLTRAEFALLSKSTSPNVLASIYGFPLNTSDSDAVLALSFAKAFARRLDLSYQDVVDLLKTRFVNPNSDIVPQFQRLGMTFKELKDFHDSVDAQAEQQFNTLLATRTAPPDPIAFGGNIFQWVRQADFNRLASVITLTETSGSPLPNSFDTLQFQVFQPAAPADNLPKPALFVRLHRLIRLWKRTGWTIAQTDAAFCTLMPFPADSADLDDFGKLDAAFEAMLPRFGAVVRIVGELQLSPQTDLLSLLTCWAAITTYGPQSLYAKLFLNATILSRDIAFVDDGFGHVLPDNTAEALVKHREALCAAVGLTSDEFDLIVADRKFDANAKLTLANVSDCFRRGWLARKFKISVRELVALVRYTGLDPFASPFDAAKPPLLELVYLIRDLKSRSLKPSALSALVWNDDWSGKASPAVDPQRELARSLRADFIAIEAQFSSNEGPLDALIRTRLALVYPADVVDAFWGLLTDTSRFAVPYTQVQPMLAPAILALAGDQRDRLAYDAARHLLTFRGELTADLQSALKAVAGSTAEFKGAVDALADGIAKAKDAFFAGHPELKPLYDDYRNASWALLSDSLTLSVAYTQPEAVLSPSILDAAKDQADRLAYDSGKKLLSFRGKLNTDLQAALKNAAGASDTFKAAVDALVLSYNNTTAAFLAQHLELTSLFAPRLVVTDELPQKQGAFLRAFNPILIPERQKQQILTRLSAEIGGDLDATRQLLDDATLALMAESDPAKPAWADLLAAKTVGLSLDCFTGTTPNPPPLSSSLGSNLKFDSAVNPLPIGTQSVVMKGFVEAPESTFFNLFITAAPASTVKLTLDGKDCQLGSAGGLFQNKDKLEWKAGTLIEFELTVGGLANSLNVQWETPVRSRATIPPAYLYPKSLFDTLCHTRSRCIKAATLGTALGLSIAELRRPQIDAHCWLNAIPVAGLAADPQKFLPPLQELLAYAVVKADLTLPEGDLATILIDPTIIFPQPKVDPLLAVINATAEALTSVMAYFGFTRSQLVEGPKLRRVKDALEAVRTVGVSLSSLVDALTNDPTSAQVRKFQDALRARYAADSWRDLVQPIHDSVRTKQRDALVAHILHRLREAPETRQIDTADKLFEYFLMDVQMEPIVQTSRVRHALSSVQLFTERCLMNLEPTVSPKSLNAKRWNWMKRYRIWEANRKVFLFPENWIEPELRDDKSSFFKELESELLQSDITEDSAATAMLAYLYKLEEVAKLEPCGSYVIEADAQANRGETLHVVGRTAGARRKYYYRRRDGGTWTSWELMKLDIEDNPMMPVVWNDRLFVFWLRVLQQAPLDPATVTNARGDAKADGTELAHANIGDTRKSAGATANQTTQITFQAVLCYSEYAGGKWQPTKTSDVLNPMTLTTCLFKDFNRASLRLTAGIANSVLNIGVLGAAGSRAFALYNTHSLPVPYGNLYWETHKRHRYFDSNQKTFSIRYTVQGIDNKLVQYTRNLFEPVFPHTAVEPIQDMNDYWTAPFFYADSQGFYFVRTQTQTVPIFDWPHFGVGGDPGIHHVPHVPPIFVNVAPGLVSKPKVWGDGSPVDPGLLFNPGPIQAYVRTDGLIRQGVSAAGVLIFDGVLGPSGTIIAAKALQGVQP